MRRDPASLSRIMFTVVALLLLWPGLVITEFRPATLLDPNNLGTIGAFLGGFWPPELSQDCLLYTSPSPRDRQKSRMPSSA